VTPKERIGETLAGRFADRRAVAPVLSLYGCRMTGSNPERYYRHPELFLEGQRSVVRRFDPDIVFGPYALALEAGAYGAPLIWPPYSPPNVRKPMPAGTGGTVSPPSSPAPISSESLSFLVESVRQLTGEFGNSRPVAAVITAPTDLPAMLLGIDLWLELLLFDAQSASLWLAMAEEHFVALATAYFEAGASFVVVPVMFANPAIMMDSLIRKPLLPTLASAFGRIPGPVFFHHGANPLAANLNHYAALPNVEGFILDERDDPKLARAMLGPERLLVTGPAGPRMSRRPAANVLASVQQLLANMATDPRLMVATTAADIPWDTDEPTIAAIMDAAIAMGRPHA
jgi:uroporphyrinogen decarboxylase